jgi:serine/threonine protein phosphatase PrpC
MQSRAAGVFDGVGGHDAGEVASALARDTVSGHVAEIRSAGAAWPARAVQTAREQLVAAKAQGRSNMGTTAVVAALSKDAASIAWCGDSRAYGVLPDGGLVLLTTDHNLVYALHSRELITDKQMQHLNAMLDSAMNVSGAHEAGRELPELAELIKRHPRLIKNWTANKFAGETQARYLNALLREPPTPETDREIAGTVSEIVFNSRHTIFSEVGSPSSQIGQVVVPTAKFVAILLTSDGIHDNLATADLERAVRSGYRRGMKSICPAVVAAARVSADSGLGRAKHDDMTAVLLPVTA